MQNVQLIRNKKVKEKILLMQTQKKIKKSKGKKGRVSFIQFGNSSADQKMPNIKWKNSNFTSKMSS